MHKSVATIDNPEFINLQPLEINPLMSSCEIKVFYLGENRNHSYITKDVATEMAKTLRGAPIVGYYKEDSNDFGDHGQKVIIDDEGVKFECMTKPYGFVSPDAKVWFQKFEDTDDFGNVIEREYLMTTGYLWTEQFEECKSVLESGKPQSMELDEKTLDGHWSTNNNTGMDFFIINDAIFSKLCILGENVEPCFEGASVTAPDVSTTFTKIDDTFKNTLYSMIKDLKKYTIEGGQNMEIENKEDVILEETNVAEAVIEDSTEVQPETDMSLSDESSLETEVEETSEVETETETDTEFGCQKNKTKCEKEEEEENDMAEEDKKEEEKDKDSENKYTLLSEQYETLSNQYTQLQEEYNKLVEFKREIEDKEKDNLIKQFYMLSDEDKADVVANKANYSLEEIEAKLSVICVRNKVSFESKENEQQETQKAVVTFNLNDTESDVPGYISALRNTQNRNKNK